MLRKPKFSDVKTLAVLLLVSMAFLDSQTGQYVSAAILVIWLSVHALRLFKGAIRQWTSRLKTRMTQWRGKLQTFMRKFAAPTPAPAVVQSRQEPMVIPEVASDFKAVMLRHINARITEKLQAGFPEAAWSWCDPSPIDIAADGGIGRIQTENTGRYSHAEVTFEKNGVIRIKMLELAELPKKPPDPAAAKTDPNAIDLSGWYEVNASSAVRAAIDEVYVRGYRKLYLNEKGELYTRIQNACSLQGKISRMPGKQLWKDLVPLFAADEIKASVGNEIELTWN